MNLKIKLLSIIIIMHIFGFTQDTTSSFFYDSLEFIGVSIREPGYHVWGSSPIVGPDGKYHLFAARWPVSAKFVPGWKTHSEAAHYVCDSAEGLFTFSDVALTGTGTNTWDRQGGPLILS